MRGRNHFHEAESMGTKKAGFTFIIIQDDSQRQTRLFHGHHLSQASAPAIPRYSPQVVQS
jgi:hypothetical protein